MKSNAQIFRGSSLPRKRPFNPNLKKLLVKAFKIGMIESDSPLNFIKLSNIDSDELVENICDILERKNKNDVNEKYFLENCIRGKKSWLKERILNKSLKNLLS